jgi:hypothetical protein
MLFNTQNDFLTGEDWPNLVTLAASQSLFLGSKTRVQVRGGRRQ